MKVECDSRQILGRGLYGTVFRGIYEDRPVAVKRIQVIDLEDANLREEEALRKIRHPNVIRLFHVEEDDVFKYFVLELCNASLDQCFLRDGDPRKYRGLMPSDVNVLIQLANGLQYIHSQELVHRDIRPENVLVCVGPPLRIKWTGFGLCKPLDSNGTFPVDGIEGNVNWMAPEILARVSEIEITLFNPEQSTSPNGQRFTVATDVFSAGCLFFYFLSKGVHPFGWPHNIVNNIIKDNPIHYDRLPCNHFAAALIRSMIANRAEERSTLEDIVNQLKPLSKSAEDREIQFEEHAFLSSGAYGAVYRGTYHEQSVAVKRILLADFQGIEMEKEEEALMGLDHENVVKLLHVEQDELFKYYALELCTASLNQYFLKDTHPKKYRGPMPTEIEVMQQLTSGLEYIHSKGLVHRDIKPENVLIARQPETVVMKWADFGLSKPICPRGTFALRDVKGTLTWMAPEVLTVLEELETSGKNDLNLSSFEKRCTAVSDVFSCGCVFFYFLTGGIHPFGWVNSFYNVIQSNPIHFHSLPADHFATEIIHGMISNKMENRPSLAEVYKKLSV